MRLACFFILSFPTVIWYTIYNNNITMKEGQVVKCKVAILPKINEPFVIEECELSETTPTQVR
jgi:hypothetical protein